MRSTTTNPAPQPVLDRILSDPDLARARQSFYATVYRYWAEQNVARFRRLLERAGYEVVQVIPAVPGT